MESKIEIKKYKEKAKEKGLLLKFENSYDNNFTLKLASKYFEKIFSLYILI
jgi:hypothetical protein